MNLHFDFGNFGMGAAIAVAILVFALPISGVIQLFNGKGGNRNEEMETMGSKSAGQYSDHASFADLYFSGCVAAVFVLKNGCGVCAKPDIVFRQFRILAIM